MRCISGFYKVDWTTFPRLRAYRSAAFNLPRSSTTLIPFDTVIYNKGGGTFSGGRYTVPRDGHYVVSTNFLLTDSPVSGWCQLFKNGTLETYLYYTTSSNYPNYAATTTVELVAGDIIDIRFANEQTGRDPALYVYSSNRVNNLSITFVSGI